MAFSSCASVVESHMCTHARARARTHTHTHTHIYNFFYMLQIVAAIFTVVIINIKILHIIWRL